MRSKSYVFPCGKWLTNADKASLTQTLMPRDGDGSAPPVVNYEVVVYTSDLRGAGTDANVSLSLHGAAGETSDQKLDNSANNFERGELRHKQNSSSLCLVEQRPVLRLHNQSTASVCLRYACPVYGRITFVSTPQHAAIRRTCVSSSPDLSRCAHHRRGLFL